MLEKYKEFPLKRFIVERKLCLEYCIISPLSFLSFLSKAFCISVSVNTSRLPPAECAGYQLLSHPRSKSFFMCLVYPESYVCMMTSLSR